MFFDTESTEELFVPVELGLRDLLRKRGSAVSDDRLPLGEFADLVDVME